MAFAKLTNELSTSIRKAKDETEFTNKILAAKELLGSARILGTHTARFSSIAWNLDMLFLALAILLFYAALLAGALKDVMPAAIYQAIDSDGFLYFLLGLVAIPAVFHIIFAVVCRLTPVTVGEQEEPGSTEDAPGDVQEKLQQMEKILKDMQKALDPVEYFPDRSVALSIFFAIPLAITTFFSGVERKPSSILGFLGVVFACIILFVLVFGLFVLLLDLKMWLSALFYSSWKCRKQAKKLLDEFLANQVKYKAQCEAEEWRRSAEEQERKRLDGLREGAELYKRAMQGEAIDENLMVLAAEKGDPQASLHIGEQILMLVNDSGLTDREIAEFYEDAKDYFQTAADAGIPDGIFWHAATQLLTESHSEDGWMDILRRIRALDKTKLSDACLNSYDEVVEQLVSVINSAAARAEQHRRQQQAEDAALMAEIMSRPCRYSNGTICTRKSTPSFPHFCNGDGKGSNFCVEYAK